MSSETETKQEENLVVHYSISFKKICLLTVSCPFVALIVCFVTAYIFQANDIHETHCRVYNIVPSISAITGISPQRYLWRISVAFHIGPRLIIAAVHRAYHISLIQPDAKLEDQQKAQFWFNSAFMLTVIETGSLCGVTYISNRENYPVHEKLFITFMISSLTHMLTCIKGMKVVCATATTVNVYEALQLKQTLFNISLISAIGLVAFFLEHRLLCHRMAFSMFALCEYVIALANMAFHVSVILDFPTEHLVIARGLKIQHLVSSKTKSIE